MVQPNCTAMDILLVTTYGLNKTFKNTMLGIRGSSGVRGVHGEGSR